ncbi:hypothetical protein JXL83_10235, partial [candidate division WOR-3 bacterium]|nr:hypothetical protein [candidate division WOR-3 bacterium]
YGGDVVFSGKIRRRSIAFSVTMMHVDADTTEAVGYSFEAYKIETDIAEDQQWLIVMDFRHHDEEKIVSPEMPSYSAKFSTSNFEFDKKYYLYADKKPTAKFFQKPEKLKKLAERKLRAAVAGGGKLTLYFNRPIVWKYSSFKKVEELIRLCLELE